MEEIRCQNLYFADIFWPLQGWRGFLSHEGEGEEGGGSFTIKDA